MRGWWRVRVTLLLLLSIQLVIDTYSEKTWGERGWHTTKEKHSSHQHSQHHHLLLSRQRARGSVRCDFRPKFGLHYGSWSSPSTQDHAAPRSATQRHAAPRSATQHHAAPRSTIFLWRTNIWKDRYVYLYYNSHTQRGVLLSYEPLHTLSLTLSMQRIMSLCEVFTFDTHVCVTVSHIMQESKGG